MAENLKEVIPYERDVFYYETDRMGIVHHSNYIRMLEEARTHFYAVTGYSYPMIEEAGLMIPVLSASCQYKIPFKFGERIKVVIKPVLFNGVRFGFEYELYEATTGELKALGASEHCFSDYDLKPVRVDRNNVALFEAFKPYFPERKKKAN